MTSHNERISLVDKNQHNESLEIYNDRELSYLDKYLPYVKNAYDEDELYEIIIDCDFNDKQIEKKINEKLRYINAKGLEYGWNMIDRHRSKPVEAAANQKKEEESNKKKLKAKKKGKIQIKHYPGETEEYYNRNVEYDGEYNYNDNDNYTNYNYTYNNCNDYNYNDYNYNRYNYNEYNEQTNTHEYNTFKSRYDHNNYQSYPNRHPRSLNRSNTKYSQSQSNDNFYEKSYYQQSYHNYNDYYNYNGDLNYNNKSDKNYNKYNFNEYDYNYSYRNKYKKKKRPHNQQYDYYQNNPNNFRVIEVELVSDIKINPGITEETHESTVVFSESPPKPMSSPTSKSMPIPESKTEISFIDPGTEKSSNQVNHDVDANTNLENLPNKSEAEIEEINVNKTDIENLRSYFDRLKQYTIFNENTEQSGIFEKFSNFTGNNPNNNKTSSLPSFISSNINNFTSGSGIENGFIKENNKSKLLNNLQINNSHVIEITSNNNKIDDYDDKSDNKLENHKKIVNFSIFLSGSERKNKPDENVKNITNSATTNGNNIVNPLINQIPSTSHPSSQNYYSQNFTPYSQYEYPGVQRSGNPYIGVSMNQQENEIFKQQPMYEYGYNPYPYYQMPYRMTPMQYPNYQNYPGYQEIYQYPTQEVYNPYFQQQFSVNNNAGNMYTHTPNLSQQQYNQSNNSHHISNSYVSK